MDQEIVPAKRDRKQVVIRAVFIGLVTFVSLMTILGLGPADNRESVMAMFRQKDDVAQKSEEKTLTSLPFASPQQQPEQQQSTPPQQPAAEEATDDQSPWSKVTSFFTTGKQQVVEQLKTVQDAVDSVKDTVNSAKGQVQKQVSRVAGNVRQTKKELETGGNLIKEEIGQQAHGMFSQLTNQPYFKKNRIPIIIGTIAAFIALGVLVFLVKFYLNPAGAALMKDVGHEIKEIIVPSPPVPKPLIPLRVAVFLGLLLLTMAGVIAGLVYAIRRAFSFGDLITDLYTNRHGLLMFWYVLLAVTFLAGSISLQLLNNQAIWLAVAAMIINIGLVVLMIVRFGSPVVFVDKFRENMWTSYCHIFEGEPAFLRRLLYTIFFAFSLFTFIFSVTTLVFQMSVLGIAVAAINVLVSLAISPALLYAVVFGTIAVVSIISYIFFEPARGFWRNFAAVMKYFFNFSERPLNAAYVLAVFLGTFATMFFGSYITVPFIILLCISIAVIASKFVYQDDPLHPVPATDEDKGGKGLNKFTLDRDYNEVYVSVLVISAVSILVCAYMASWTVAIVPVLVSFAALIWVGFGISNSYHMSTWKDRFASFSDPVAKPALGAAAPPVVPPV